MMMMKINIIVINKKFFYYMKCYIKNFKMNEKKVAFVCIEGIHGLLDQTEDFSVNVGLYPKGESSSGKIFFTEKGEPKCNTTWSLIYHSELDELIFFSLNLKNIEYAKLLLPIKWFEVNKVVKESFPMLVTYQKADVKAKFMMTVSVHRSENGGCAFLADQGHLLVKPEWNKDQTESSNNNAQRPAPNIQQHFNQSQQMVYFNPGQQTYMVPITNAGQNQVLVPMQIQGQFFGQMPFAANPYQYPIQSFICAPNGQSQIQPSINQQQIQNFQIQPNLIQQNSDDKEPNKTEQIEPENTINQNETSRKNIQEIDKNIQEVQQNQDSQLIDQETQKTQIDQNDKNDHKTRQVQLNDQKEKEDNQKADQKEKEEIINQEVDQKPKKAKASQNTTKSDRKSKKDQQNNQEVDQKIKKAQANSESLKTTQKSKKMQSGQANQKLDQKDKKGQLNQENQKTEQKSKNAQSSQDSPKVEQKAKKVRTKDSIPVLQPITVYIKSSDGKLKPMLLIPSTKDTPALLKHINQ